MSVSVPFELESTGVVGSGVLVMHAHGLLRLEPEQLVIEYSSGSTDLREYTGVSIIIDTGQGARPGTESGLTTVRVPLEAVAELKVTGGVFRQPRLHLEVSRVGLLADIPWAKGARCSFPLRRADRERARSLAADVQLLLADARLRELEGPGRDG